MCLESMDEGYHLLDIFIVLERACVPHLLEVAADQLELNDQRNSLACSIAAVFSTSCIEVVCDGETFEPLLQPFDVSLNYVRFDRGLVAMGS